MEWRLDDKRKNTAGYAEKRRNTAHGSADRRTVSTRRGAVTDCGHDKWEKAGGPRALGLRRPRGTRALRGVTVLLFFMSDPYYYHLLLR